jgi:hypothetical protein
MYQRPSVHLGPIVAAAKGRLVRSRSIESDLTASYSILATGVSHTDLCALFHTCTLSIDLLIIGMPEAGKFVGLLEPYGGQQED